MVLVIETVTMGLLGAPWDYIFQSLMNDNKFWYDFLVVPSWKGWNYFIESIFARTPTGYRARTRPIGTLYILFLLGNLVRDIRQFYYLFGSILLIVDLSMVYYLMKISDMLNSKTIRKIFIGYCFSPTIITFGFARVDLIPTFLMITVIYYYLNNKDILVGVLLGLGIGIKWFPLALLGSVFLLQIKKKEMRRLAKITVNAIAIVFLMYLPFILFRFRYFKDFFSLYGDPSLTRPDTLIGVIDKWTQYSFDAALKLIFLAILIFVFILLILKGPQNIEQRTLSFLSAFLLLIGYIYSPQWTIWIIPLLALNKKISYKIIWILEFSNVLVFPYLYSAIELSTGFATFSLINPLTVLFSIFVIIRSSALVVILFTHFQRDKV